MFILIRWLFWRYLLTECWIDFQSLILCVAQDTLAKSRRNKDNFYTKLGSYSTENYYCLFELSNYTQCNTLGLVTRLKKYLFQYASQLVTFNTLCIFNLYVTIIIDNLSLNNKFKLKSFRWRCVSQQLIFIFINLIARQAFKCENIHKYSHIAVEQWQLFTCNYCAPLIIYRF